MSDLTEVIRPEDCVFGNEAEANYRVGIALSGTLWKVIANDY